MIVQHPAISLIPLDAAILPWRDTIFGILQHQYPQQIPKIWILTIEIFRYLTSTSGPHACRFSIELGGEPSMIAWQRTLKIMNRTRICCLTSKQGRPQSHTSSRSSMVFSTFQLAAQQQHRGEPLELAQLSQWQLLADQQRDRDKQEAMSPFLTLRPAFPDLLSLFLTNSDWTYP